MTYCPATWPIVTRPPVEAGDHKCNLQVAHLGRCICVCGAEAVPPPIPIQTRRETPELQTWTDDHQERADRALQPRHPEES